MCAKSLSRVRLFVAPWTIAHQLLCPSDFPGKKPGVGHHALLGDLLNPGIKPTSLMSPALAGRCFLMSATWEALEGDVPSRSVVSDPPGL